MSVGLKVTVYNESGAFLAAGWKKHYGYTLSGINVLENILTNLLGWANQYMVDSIKVTAESLKLMNMYNDELTSWQTGFGDNIIIRNKYSNLYNDFISFFNDNENICVDGSIDIYLCHKMHDGYIRFNVWHVYETEEELKKDIGIEEFNKINFEVLPNDEALIHEPYELVHFKDYEKLLDTTKVMFYNRQSADNYYFKTKSGRYISLNA